MSLVITMKVVALFIAMALSLRAETGSFTIHRMLHALGEERYDIAPSAGGLTLNSTFEYSDRGRKRGTTAVLNMKSDYTPVTLQLAGEEGPYTAEIRGGLASVKSWAPAATFQLLIGISPSMARRRSPCRW
jgi:hypothetical protein